MIHHTWHGGNECQMVIKVNSVHAYWPYRTKKYIVERINIILT